MWLALTIILFFALIALHFWWRKRYLDLESAQTRTTRELQSRHAQELAEKSGEQEALFNSMVEGVLILDQNGRIRIANAGFRNLFAITEKVEGRTVIEALRFHELSQLVDTLMTREAPLEAELSLHGLAEKIVQVNGAPLIDVQGEQTGSILVFHDLTRLKQLENTRQEFVANVSHELRTPLSLIKGCVETLIDGVKDDPEAEDKFLHTIDKHANRLTFLIDDLLTISQLESGRLVLECKEILISDLLKNVIHDFATRAKENQIDIRLSVSPELEAHADPNRSAQVLHNLIDNAIKYGNRGGYVAVKAQENADEVEIWVEDNGPGIPVEAQERVFERFYRLDKARSREQGGTGLGLSIVKHIVQTHGGKVWVKSTLGQGSAFHFTLPRKVSRD